MIFKNTQPNEPVQLTILMVPDFSMIAFSSLLEPLRIANWIRNKNFYEWQLVSENGRPVVASNGIEVSVSHSIADITSCQNIIVCAGMGGLNYYSKAIFSWLRKCNRDGAYVGSICTGSAILARAGLLKNYRCTIHWSSIEAFLEIYPDIDVRAELFEVDGKRFTGAGGFSSFDMVLFDIAKRIDSDLAMQVSDQCMHERLREGHDQQRLPLHIRLGIKHPKLLQAISVMEEHTEDIVSRDDIAHETGISRRQLERLFRRYLNISPARYYLQIRLTKARNLLGQTAMPVTEIAFACGFASASHFSKCYREMYGFTPRNSRIG